MLGHDMSEGVAMAEEEDVVEPVKLSRRMLKKKRQLVARGKGSRSDYLDVYGAQARAELEVHPPSAADARALSFHDLQALVGCVLAEGESPVWVSVKNKPLVTKVVMLHIPGLDAALYMEHPGLFKSLKKSCGVPRAAVGVSPMATPAQTIESLFSCPKSKTGKSGVKRKHSDSEEVEGNFKRIKVLFPASYYTLTAREMCDNGYPDAEAEMELGFVKTLPAPENVTALEMVAVDCEMCCTCEGLELTRVSIVSAQGEVLMDRLVKPGNPITNYNTQYSGITAEMMAGVTRSLADVQEEILRFVSAETIMVGHSVENDLMALKISHPLVIDTALLYHHPSRGPMCKPALRMLSARYLKRNIQGDKLGHDSVEDARATMDLVLLKISKGPGFGTRMKANSESLVEVLSRHGRRCSLIDQRPVLHQYAVGACNAIVATSDDDACAKAVKEVKKTGVDFVWAQFTELNAYYEDQARATENCPTRIAEMMATMTCSGKSGTKSEFDVGVSLPDGFRTVLARLDDQFQKLYDALEPNTLLIVATGHGDTATVRRLQELKWKICQNKGARSSEWTENHEDVLEEFAARAQTTLAFTCIK